MFLSMAIGEAKRGRFGVVGGQLIYPSIVDPGSEAPAAVIVVEVGVLKLAFDKNILQAGV